jgi:hypothetical protein
MTKVATPNDLYSADFFAWTQQQAKLLRERRFDDLDLENLSEEVEAVGRSDKREIRSRLLMLLAHLLKWKYQPGARSKSWSATIREQRREIAQVVEDSPSLKSYPAEQLRNSYPGARLIASQETGIAFDLFPEQCPFSSDNVLDSEFLPEEPGHIGSTPG